MEIFIVQEHLHCCLFKGFEESDYLFCFEDFSREHRSVYTFVSIMGFSFMLNAVLCQLPENFILIYKSFLFEMLALLGRKHSRGITFN